MLRRLIALSVLLSGVFAAFMLAVIASQWRSLPDGVGKLVFELGYPYTQQARYDKLVIEALGANSPFVGQQAEALLDPLTTFGASAIDGASCAPDGQSLLFFAPYLFQLDVRSKALTQLTFLPRAVFALASSPDQKQIAFVEAINSGGSMLLTGADADGSHLSALYFPIDEFLDVSLSWSPDSREIAFVQAVPAGDQVPSFKISIIDVATHKIRLVYQSTQELSQVSWSPDGTRLAFQMRDPVYDDIYSIETDGTGLTRLTHDPQQDFDPRWSPDGSLISYGFVSASDPFQLYVMNADGSDPHPVFVASGEHEIRNLCWLRE